MGGARLSWVPPASIHLTLKFLGETREQRVEPLRRTIEAVGKDHFPLSMPITRWGAFPQALEPNVLWVGAPEPWGQSAAGQRLFALQQSVENGCDALGFAPERRSYSPHLTLARVHSGARSLGSALAKSGVMDSFERPGTLEVRSVVLMRSDGGPAGPVYTKLWDVPL
jgi:2'-5' RNA ligase